MICPALTRFIGPRANLNSGALFADFPHPARCLSREELAMFNLGKDLAIDHIQRGGNGYPSISSDDPTVLHLIDLGMTTERRDLRAYKIWSASFTECQRDARNGLRS